METELQNTLMNLTMDRYAKEMSVADRLVSKIQESIEVAEPIREQFFFAGDAFAVMMGQLLLPYPEDPPIPVINSFDPVAMNYEQQTIIQEWVDALTVADHKLLYADIESLLQRCSSANGPYGVINKTTYSMSPIVSSVVADDKSEATHKAETVNVEGDDDTGASTILSETVPTKNETKSTFRHISLPVQWRERADGNLIRLPKVVDVIKPKQSHIVGVETVTGYADSNFVAEKLKNIHQIQ